MIQDRTTITTAFMAELARFAALVRRLDAEQLGRPSRCEGWTAGDVAGHFIGSIAEISEGQLDGQGTPEVTARQVAARRGRTAAELAEELDKAAAQLQGLVDVLDDSAWAAPAGGGFDGSLGLGVEALLYDGVVHSDDIAAAVGITYAPTDAGVIASVSHVAEMLTRQGWGAATLDLTGVPAVTIAGPSPGRTIGGDPLAFVLAGAGRADPATIGLDASINIYA
jgi:uncharacterized protein (TIGR03083 family)